MVVAARKYMQDVLETFEETDPYEKKIRNRKHLRKNRVISKENITENQEDEKNDEQA